VLGLDEAGRGSVLGPLVIGGFLCSESDLADLPALGARDSKQLSPTRREEVYRALARRGRRLSVTLPPETVDRAVRLGRLNDLEASAFAQLVRATNPGSVCVDACDVRAERFGARIAGLSNFSGPLDSRHHADRDLPVVGAASIVAKVRRDASIARLTRKLGCSIGSGYPSDPETVAYLRTAVSTGAPIPRWVRASWATTERVKRERPTTTLDRFLS
jgi:ribonuclease HII